MEALAPAEDGGQQRRGLLRPGRGPLGDGEPDGGRVPLQGRRAGGEQGVGGGRALEVVRVVGVGGVGVLGGREQAQQHRIGVLGPGLGPEACSALLGHGGGGGFRRTGGSRTGGSGAAPYPWGRSA
ncbi:hypothetical protein GCM10009639_64680 [Kitasatospora putterlickiae]|uniref:Uncharacterized protein n=1 Tax=Kitasatospora putterlickiae TaxID=221725 RepID=A0ABP4J4M3_9ACTN